eukprot:8387951-Pyramimonas_sp.AAC.1
MALRAMLGQLPGKQGDTRPRTQLNGAQYQEIHAVAITGVQAQSGRRPCAQEIQDSPLAVQATARVRAAYRRPSPSLSEEPRHAHAAP